MTETLREARAALAGAATTLYHLALEATTGTPAHVDRVERFSATCHILFGLVPVEILRAVHASAAERTGRPLTDDAPDADVLAHKAAMVEVILAHDAAPPPPVALDAPSATTLAKAIGVRFLASLLTVSYALPSPLVRTAKHASDASSPGVPPPRVCAALRYAAQALEQCYRPDEWAAVSLTVKRHHELLSEPGEPVHVPDDRLVGVIETLISALVAPDAPPPTAPSEPSR